jgi:hypothetical protein
LLLPLLQPLRRLDLTQQHLTHLCQTVTGLTLLQLQLRTLQQ